MESTKEKEIKVKIIGAGDVVRRDHLSYLEKLAGTKLS